MTTTRLTNPNELLQLVSNRINRTLKTINSRMWSDVTPITFEATPVLDLPVGAKELLASQPKWSPCSLGEVLGPTDNFAQRWLRFDIPAAKPGEKGKRFIRHMTEPTRGEFTLHIDGIPYVGLDRAHNDALLPDQGGSALLEVGLYWFFGKTKPFRLSQLDIAVRDDDQWQAYWDLSVWLNYARALLEQEDQAGSMNWGFQPEIEEVPALARIILRALDHACDTYNTKGPVALRGAIAQLNEELPSEAWQPRATLVGHAHLDLVWMWPEVTTQRKAIHTFANMLRIMERYPEFVFNQSSPCLYDDIKELEPELFEQVQQRINEGRWEVTGGLLVESDTQLPSGEALARALVLGQRGFEKLQGRASNLCWIPDVFGYNASLPQILVQGGVTRFYTQKMIWSSLTRFPYSSFIWRGHDGSEVLSHVSRNTYEEKANIRPILKTARVERQVHIARDFLMPTGEGDGGGGAHDDVLERARRYTNMAGVPRVRWATGEQFFDDLEDKRNELPTYRGEMYLEYHRGTYTTQSEFKRLYRACERALQAHEAAAVVTGASPVDDSGWKRVCFAQFHDALPGSSITRVYAEMNPELQAIESKELDSACALLASDDGEAGYIFNTVCAHRTVVVGEGDSQAFYKLAPLTSAALPSPQSPTKTVSHPSNTSLEAGRAKATFNDAGALVSLTIDNEDIELISPARFTIAPDNPQNFEAWDIDDDAVRLREDAFANMPLSVKDATPLSATLEGTSSIGERSSLTARYTVEADSPYLHVELEIDWQEEKKLLRYELPTAYAGERARFGCPFGAIDRTQQPGSTKDEAQWEVPGSRWAAALRDDATGATIITESKFGFSCREGVLGLSLLRSPCDPDPIADRGTHTIRFVIGRFCANTEDSTDAINNATAVDAEALYAPLLPACKPIETPYTFSKLKGLVPTWVRPAWQEGNNEHAGSVIRLHETAGGGGKAIIHTAQACEVTIVDLFDKPYDVPQPQRLDANTWAIPYTPYQMIGLLVRPV